MMDAAARGIPLIVTNDTEADDIWPMTRRFTTRNVAYLFTFKLPSERFGSKPVHLTNYKKGLIRPLCRVQP